MTEAGEFAPEPQVELLVDHERTIKHPDGSVTEFPTFDSTGVVLIDLGFERFLNAPSKYGPHAGPLQQTLSGCPIGHFRGLSRDMQRVHVITALRAGKTT